MKRCLARLLLGGGLALAAWGHGDLHERIARLDERLRGEPGRARLWLERGELHRQHRDWAAAERDLTEAARLDPALPGLELAQARLWAERGRTDDALAALAASSRSRRPRWRRGDCGRNCCFPRGRWPRRRPLGPR